MCEVDDMFSKREEEKRRTIVEISAQTSQSEKMLTRREKKDTNYIFRQSNAVHSHRSFEPKYDPIPVPYSMLNLINYFIFFG